MEVGWRSVGGRLEVGRGSVGGRLGVGWRSVGGRFEVGWGPVGGRPGDAVTEYGFSATWDDAAATGREGERKRGSKRDTATSQFILLDLNVGILPKLLSGARAPAKRAPLLARSGSARLGGAWINWPLRRSGAMPLHTCWQIFQFPFLSACWEAPDRPARRRGTLSLQTASRAGSMARSDRAGRSDPPNGPVRHPPFPNQATPRAGRPAPREWRYVPANRVGFWQQLPFLLASKFSSDSVFFNSLCIVPILTDIPYWLRKTFF